MKSFPLPYGQDIVTLVDTGDVLGMRNSHCSLMLVKLTAVARTLRRGCVGEPHRMNMDCVTVHSDALLIKSCDSYLKRTTALINLYIL